MRAALMIVLIWSAVACAAAPPRFQPSDREQISGVLRAQAEAWNRGDLVAFMAGYANTPGLVFTSGGTVRHGWQDALDHYRARYGSDRAAMGSLAFEVLEIDPVGADGAVVLGNWRVAGTEHAGSGVFSLVFERRAEGWRIIHDHTSSAPPP